ncbi:MAG: DUF4412 domain-containing protein [Bacteroidales bacterium]|nr:DUF4412 domain-containing protein [Bacteroidales bacterium]
MKTVFLILFCLSTLMLKSQKKGDVSTFEGTIVYSITTEGEIDANVKAALPLEVTLSVKGPKSLIEMQTAYGKQSVISNSETKEQIVLIDMMGQKFAVTSTKEENEKALAELTPYKITQTNETKKIAGYDCIKYEVSNENEKYDFYVAKDLIVNNLNWNTPYKEINGVLMEYCQKNKDYGVTVKYTAKEVRKSKIKDKVFEIPAGFTKMTIGEFKQMFGGE